MNSTFKSIIAFMVGAATGSIVTYFAVKTPLEKEKEEEIESVKEAFGRKGSRASYTHVNDPDPEELMRDVTDEEIANDYIHANGYASSIQGSFDKPPIDSIRPLKPPYVISPAEFNNLPEFDTLELIYYADGVLVDESDEPVDNVNELVGEDFAEHFGEYEDDSVYVRNEKLKTDISIIYSMKNFYDIKEPPTN